MITVLPDSTYVETDEPEAPPQNRVQVMHVAFGGTHDVVA